MIVEDLSSDVEYYAIGFKKGSELTAKVNEQLETCYPGLYIIGDGSGITHSLSHASASGVHVARNIADN